MSDRSFNQGRYAETPFDGLDVTPLTQALSEDNSKGAHLRMLAVNAHYRGCIWDAPFDQTLHRTHLGDARDLSWLSDNSVDLVVTSPPYWTLKQYKEGRDAQMGDIQDYEQF